MAGQESHFLCVVPNMRITPRLKNQQNYFYVVEPLLLCIITTFHLYPVLPVKTTDAYKHVVTITSLVPWLVMKRPRSA